MAWAQAGDLTSLFPLEIISKTESGRVNINKQQLLLSLSLLLITYSYILAPMKILQILKIFNIILQKLTKHNLSIKST